MIATSNYYLKFTFPCGSYQSNGLSTIDQIFLLEEVDWKKKSINYLLKCVSSISDIVYIILLLKK